MSKQTYSEIKTKQDIASEYVKGLLDPCFMIEKYLKTVDLTQGGGFKQFKLFPRQKELVRAYQTHRHNVVTKPRQTGVSTTTAAYLAVLAAYAKKDKPEEIIIIANKFASAKKFVGLIRQFLGQLPEWIWGENYDHTKPKEGHIVGKGSTETLQLVNGTKIIAKATSQDALRGYTPTYLVIDEAAYIDTYAAELYTAAMASLITGGKMIIISTPNGKDELYYKVYDGAKQKQNNFNIVNLQWYEDPRYNKDLEWHKEDEAGKVEIIKESLFTFDHFDEMVKKGFKPTSSWYVEMCGMLNWDKIAIARELDVKFAGSSGTVVEEEWIRYHEKVNVFSESEFILKEYDDKLWVFENPIEGHKYMMGVDVASGNADDYCALSIIDTTTGNQVVEYKGKIRPVDFAPIVYKYGNLYSALTVVDITGGYGDNLILKLEEAEYKYLYYSKGQQDFRKKEKRLNYDKDKLVAGYKISNMRPQIISKLTEYIENNMLKIRSIRFLSELETFVWVNGRPNHASGFNDDVIFANALALWILETEFKNLEKAKEKTKEILKIMGNSGVRNEREKVKLESTLPFQNTNDKNNKSTIYKSAQDPTGQFSWVLR